MSEPLISLIIATLIIFLLVFLFRPNSKFLNRWRQIRQNKLRVFMEDALKHIYECENENKSCTLKSIAGALSQTTNKAAQIMDHLQSSDLVNLDKGKFLLTKEGRDYALKMIRIHRLWESYLAEETGIPESAWHQEADIEEHNLSIEDAEKINRKLGYPLFDPHGAPIPGSVGEFPIERGIRLSELDTGINAVITHIEDEPITVYDNLVKIGLHRGMQIQLKEKNDKNISLNAEGQNKEISHLEALNISVAILPDKKGIKYPLATLDSLKKGQQGEIMAISRACHGQQRRRLMDLGILPGTQISVELESLGNDPIAYQVRGTTIALRRQQAKMIHIKPFV